MKLFLVVAAQEKQHRLTEEYAIITEVIYTFY